MKLPQLAFRENRDERAWVALLASIGGSMALTGFAAVLVLILWLGHWPQSTAETRVGLLGRAMLLALGGSLVVLISLGLAINRRSVKVSKDGIDVSGGDDPELGASVTTTTKTEVTP